MGIDDADDHEALVARMSATMERETAVQLDMLAQVYFLVLESSSQRPEAVADYRSTIDQITAAMGGEFTERYERSLRQTLAADKAAQQAHFEVARELHARSEAGKPWVSEQEVAQVLSQGGADLVLGALNPSVLAGLERELGQVDFEKLPDDDLGKQLFAALREKQKK